MKSKLVVPAVATMTALVSMLSAAQSIAPADAFSYSRKSSMTYDSRGRLATETTEPGTPALCATTTYTYDAYGNQTGTATTNCAGATGPALFLARSTTATFAAKPVQPVTVNGSAVNVAVPGGVFSNSLTNAKGHVQQAAFDPRFGAALVSSDYNAVSLNTVLDDFGRVSTVTLADNTREVRFYCMVPGSGLDASSATLSCPTPAANEAPPGAKTFVHSEPRNTSNAKMGPFVREYRDELGRVLRKVTQSFDGPNQPTALRGALVATDTVYSRYGSVVLETAPYFLSTGATGTADTNVVGARMMEYDRLGRVTKRYEADIEAAAPSARTFSDGRSGTSVGYGYYGSRTASVTTYGYSGLATTESNNAGQLRRAERDALSRVVRTTDPSGAQLAFVYDSFGNLVQTTDALQNRIVATFDARGNRLTLDDPDKGLLTTVYNALGETVRTQTANQLVAATATTFEYDSLGRPARRTEPEFVTTWFWDAYANGSACSKGIAQVCEVQTSNGFTRKFAFDGLGRAVAQRWNIASGPSLAMGVSYDPATGRTLGTTYPSGLEVAYGYSAMGHPTALTLATPASVAPLPATPGGTPAAGATLAANTVLWRADVADARGSLESTWTSNGVTSRVDRDPLMGRVLAKSAGIGTGKTVQDQAFNWDPLGNLSGRTDNRGTGDGNAVSESFAYGDNGDNTKNVNRLTRYTVAGAGIPGLSRTVDIQYNAIGSMLGKSDVGNYSHAASGATSVRPHLIASVTGGAAGSISYQADANGNVTSASSGSYRTLAYTSFDLPDSSSGVAGPSGSPRYTWAYNDAHERIKETRVIGGAGVDAGSRTVWYFHPDGAPALAFEQEVNQPTTPSAANPSATTNRHFLTANGEAIGVLASSGPLPALGAAQIAPSDLACGASPCVALNKVEYWHKDHLGSVSATTDHSGAVTERFAYDPFGKRRFTSGAYDGANQIEQDWSAAVNKGTARGFTAHEHLDDIGIVHMNGRLFDPRVGNFLQADPVIVQPYDLQSYNRYAYVRNNPLNAVDPSGFIENDDYETTHNEGSEASSSRGSESSDRGTLVKSEVLGEDTVNTYYKQSAPRPEQLAGTLAVVLPNVTLTAVREPLSPIDSLTIGLGQSLGDLTRGWSNNMDIDNTYSLDAYKAGMAARTFAEVLFGVPQDFSQASGLDYTILAAGFIPGFGHSAKLAKLLRAEKAPTGPGWKALFHGSIDNGPQIKRFGFRDPTEQYPLYVSEDLAAALDAMTNHPGLRPHMKPELIEMRIPMTLYDEMVRKANMPRSAFNPSGVTIYPYDGMGRVPGSGLAPLNSTAIGITDAPTVRQMNRFIVK